MLGGDLLLSAPPRPTPRPPIMDGQPPAVLMSAASARFFAIDWWLVPGYRLDGWAPMIVFDAARALDIHERLAPLVKAMFVETSPAPVKAALALAGRMGPTLRLPLVEPAEASRQAIAAAVAAFGQAVCNSSIFGAA